MSVDLFRIASILKAHIVEIIMEVMQMNTRAVKSARAYQRAGACVDEPGSVGEPVHEYKSDDGESADWLEGMNVITLEADEHGRLVVPGSEEDWPWD